MSHAGLIRSLLSVILVAVMVACAEFTGLKEFIFPEIGALCIGLWVVNKHVWRVKKWQIPIIFTFAAFVGVCIVRYLHVSLPLQMELGFFVVAMALMVFDASITPAISACMLPVLMATDSWLYLFVVFVLSLVLTVGQWVMERMGVRNVSDNNLKFTVPPSRFKILVRWLSLMLILLPILVCASFYDVKFVMVPPLIVTLVEFSNSASGFRQKPFSTWGILVLAACLGAFSEEFMYLRWHLPQTLSAVADVSLILLLFNCIGRYFAPAVAITLVPMILPVSVLLFYPIYVALGAAYFIAIAELCFSQRVRHIFIARN